MTDADKVMNPQHSGSDPADIRIQIRINPEIRIRMDGFWLEVKRLGGGLRSLSTVQLLLFLSIGYASTIKEIEIELKADN